MRTLKFYTKGRFRHSDELILSAVKTERVPGYSEGLQQDVGTN